MAGCDSKKSSQFTSKDQKYSIYAMMKGGKEYIVQTDSLLTGTLNPEQKGTPVIPPRLYYDLIVNNGNYYRVDWKTNSFIKYRVETNVFRKQAELPLIGISTIENYNWISKDSLLIIGYDEKTKSVRYAKIQVKEMKAVQGKMQIPRPFEPFNAMSVGFSKLVDDKLLVGYTYHLSNNLNSYTSSDTIYVETLSYPEMKYLSRSKDTRSAYPGGENTRQSHTFTDEKGDFYFIACPGIAYGNNPKKPTGIFRIKKSQTAIDPDYFFNISSSPIQNHGYGLWYVGNGKAIVRTERRALFTGMKDHYKVPHFDFYLLDLNLQSVERLDLPLDKGTSRQCILVDDNVVYITVNSDSEGSYVWLYNPQSGELKKGLKFDEKLDYILRLEKIN